MREFVDLRTSTAEARKYVMAGLDPAIYAVQPAQALVGGTSPLAGTAPMRYELAKTSPFPPAFEPDEGVAL